MSPQPVNSYLVAGYFFTTIGAAGFAYGFAISFLVAVYLGFSVAIFFVGSILDSS
jgi:hypothetical protein